MTEPSPGRTIIMIDLDGQDVAPQVMDQIRDTHPQVRQAYLFTEERAEEVYLTAIGTLLTHRIAVTYGEQEPTCTWHPPENNDLCGRPATRILWWPDTTEASPACDDPAHVALDDDAPTHILYDLHPPEYVLPEEPVVEPKPKPRRRRKDKPVPEVLLTNEPEESRVVPDVPSSSS